MMKMLIFLGNPGKKYQNNRHNIGFIIGEYLTKKYSITLNKKAFFALSGKGTIHETELFCLFPQTFMNKSGDAAAAAAKYYKIVPKEIIVIHDEIELPFGSLDIKFGGGHKGHNGIRSVIDRIGTPDFYRFRFGVGRPDNPHIPVADYLLSNFNAEEMASIRERFDDIENEIISIL